MPQPHGSQDNVNRYLEQIALAAQIETKWLRGSFANRFVIANAAPNVTGAGPTNSIIAACTLTVKASGVFIYGIEGTATLGATAALTTRVQASIGAAAVTSITVAAGTASGVGTGQIATGAATITLAGVGGALSAVTAGQQVFPTVAGLGVAVPLAMSGGILNAGVAIGRGLVCAFALDVTCAQTVAATAFSFYVMELP